MFIKDSGSGTWILAPGLMLDLGQVILTPPFLNPLRMKDRIKEFSIFSFSKIQLFNMIKAPS